jgi:hypothetical protein
MSVADATGTVSLDVATMSPAFAIVLAVAGFVTGNVNRADVPAATDVPVPSVTTTAVGVAMPVRALPVKPTRGVMAIAPAGTTKSVKLTVIVSAAASAVVALKSTVNVDVDPAVRGEADKLTEVTAVEGGAATLKAVLSAAVRAPEVAVST